MSVCIVIPPLPRYLFAGCCKQNDHSTNVGDPDHAKTILADVIGLRNTLKKFVSGLGLNRCRVLDSCSVTDCTATEDLTTSGPLRLAMACTSVLTAITTWWKTLWVTWKQPLWRLQMLLRTPARTSGGGSEAQSDPYILQAATVAAVGVTTQNWELGMDVDYSAFPPL